MQSLQGDGTADDIDDGIQGADLVKMNLVRRRVVDASFGLGQTTEHRHAPVPARCP
jgi:hypothetical protein